MTIGEVFLGIFLALSRQPNMKIDIKKKIPQTHKQSSICNKYSSSDIIAWIKKIVEKKNWGFQYYVPCTDAIVDRNGMDNHSEEKGWPDWDEAIYGRRR